MGRANDILKAKGHVVGAMNINDASIVSNGVPGKTPPPLVISPNGISHFAERPDGTYFLSTNDEQYFDIESYVGKLNGQMSRFTGFFSELWAEVFTKGIVDAKDFKSDLESSAALDASVWGNKPNVWEEAHQWERLRTIASLAQTHGNRNTDRELFYVSCK